jgi:hypothetical protein
LRYTEAFESCLLLCFFVSPYKSIFNHETLQRKKDGGRIQAPSPNFPEVGRTAFAPKKVQRAISAPILDRRKKTYGNVEVPKEFYKTATAQSILRALFANAGARFGLLD